MKDPEFGSKLVRAILNKSAFGKDAKEVDVSAGNYSVAATVIETHHADSVLTVMMGGNTGHAVDGVCLNYGVFRGSDDEAEVELLKELARKHGYKMSKRVAMTERNKP